MKLYSTGLMGFIATVASLVACIEVNQEFNITHPNVYWVGQIVLCMLFFVMAIFTLLYWNSEASVTKMRFILSILVAGLMYAIAYTGSQYSFVLIVVIGVTEIYLTRKRAGLIREGEMK